MNPYPWIIMMSNENLIQTLITWSELRIHVVPWVSILWYFSNSYILNFWKCYCSQCVYLCFSLITCLLCNVTRPFKMIFACEIVYNSGRIPHLSATLTPFTVIVSDVAFSLCPHTIKIFVVDANQVVTRTLAIKI